MLWILVAVVCVTVKSGTIFELCADEKRHLRCVQQPSPVVQVAHPDCRPTALQSEQHNKVICMLAIL